jgi:Cu/Ag efflux protein CusF
MKSMCLGAIARRLCTACMMACAVLALISCEKRAENAVPAGTSASSRESQTYTLRGRIVSMPELGKPLSQLTIHHEAVPSFVNKDGERVGMDEMTMPFTPAKGLVLRDLKPGDAIEFTFEVRWSPRISSSMTKIRKLAPDEKLNLKGE